MKTVKYKHERMSIGKLEGQSDVPVIIFETNPSAVNRGGWGKLGGNVVLPSVVLMTAVQIQDRSNPYYFITYRSNKDGYKEHLGTYVDSTFEVGVLTGVLGKKMLKQIKDAKLATLRTSLTKRCSSIGSDPEVFVVDNKNELIPAFDFLKSKTDIDRALTEEGKGVYWDGFQAEFETKADSCLGYHTDSVQYGLKQTLIEAKKHNAEAKLSIQTVMQIPIDKLENSKEEHVTLGCMPSKNVYNLEGDKVENGRTLPIRSTGGHIHFGITLRKDLEKIPEMVKGLDAILGVACVAMFAKYDNPQRRRYYGLAGEYRLPAHGMEYRVLSNAWLIHPFVMNVVFDVARLAAAFGANGYLEYWNATEKETINCINECDVAKAQEILDRNKKVFIDILGAAYPDMRDSEVHLNKIFEIFRDGMDKVIATDDIESNWHLLDGKWIRHGRARDKNCYNGTVDLVAGKVKKLA